MGTVSIVQDRNISGRRPLPNVTEDSLCEGSQVEHRRQLRGSGERRPLVWIVRAHVSLSLLELPPVCVVVALMRQDF